MERRRQVEERRKEPLAVESEHRRKPRRKARSFAGSPIAERQQIDVHDYDVVSYWSDEFDITVDELKAAVEAVGTSVKAVRDYLRRV